MTRFVALVLFVLAAFSLPRVAAAAEGGDIVAPVDPPLGKGLPIMVRVAVYFADIAAIEENDSAFVATIDVRLRWHDARLRYPAERTPRGFTDLRDEAATARLAIPAATSS